MNANAGFTDQDFDPDTAPDLSEGRWQKKMAKAQVRRGRPPNANPKVSTTIRLSAEVIEYFRGGGPGWQTRIDKVLLDWVNRRVASGDAETRTS